MIEEIELPLPHLPVALDGLRFVHLTDLHITRASKRYARLGAVLHQRKFDLALLTGDYMTDEGDEEIALQVMGELCRQIRPRFGCFGVFGNHDTPAGQQKLRALPITWLDHDAQQVGALPLTLLGAHSGRIERPDAVALALAQAGAVGAAPPQLARDEQPVRMLLCHYPDWLPIAAEMRLDVMLSGHTHGGQIRLPGGQALINHADLPLALSAGLLRQRQTYCLLPRGVGEVQLPLRVCCPPQVLLVTLRRGPMLGQASAQPVSVRRW